MNDTWQFGELTRAEAAAVLAWHYEGRDAFYDTAADPEFVAQFADPTLWRLRDLEGDRDVLLAVRDVRGAFAGFFAFKGSPDRCVIGLGLAPALTGQALGEGFVRAGLTFARHQWGVTRFCLEVAAFNGRAVTVYERLGFLETGRVSRAAPELEGEMVEFIEMTLEPDGVGFIPGRVSLRTVSEADLPVFFAQQLDPDATSMAAFPARGHDAFMDHWTKIMGDETVILRTIVCDERVAGNVVSWRRSGEQEVGYWLGKDYWGKGIATAALSQFLTQVKLRPLHAHVAKHNVASIRILEKCGFTISGEGKSPGSDGEQVAELVLMLEDADVDRPAGARNGEHG